MSLPQDPSESGSGEVAYGELLQKVSSYLVGSDEVSGGGESQAMFASANILLKNPHFSTPDDIAQLVIDGNIEAIPNCEQIITRRRVIPVLVKQTGEIFLIYSPDNGKGELDSAGNYSFNFLEDLHAVAPDVSPDGSHLILASHSDFQSIRGLIGNKEAAGRYLSVFDNTEEGAINKLIESTIAILRKLGASDLHVQPGIHHADILMRLHGLLQPIPRSHRVSLDVAKKIAHVLIQHSSETLQAGMPGDGSFRFVSAKEIKKEDIGSGSTVPTDNPSLFGTEHRVSVIPAVGGNFSSVVRLLMKAGAMKGLEELNYEGIEKFREAATIANGLVFMCGPTGSGKSTTLAAMLHDTRDSTKKLVTIEDPVEVRLEGAVQSQSNTKRNYGMAEALRYFLRHDPDQILVAEMRDAETAKLGVQAANTGHVVYTTLHANSAAESIRRLYSLGVAPLDVATTVKYIFAQRLVEQLSPEADFVEYYDAAEELAEIFGVPIQGPIYMRRPLQKGGIVGRIPIYERIAMTDGLRDLIETKGDGVSSVAIEEIALREGDFVPMEIYALRQALLGKTPLSGLLRNLNKMRLRKFKDLALQMIEQLAVRELETN